MKPSPDMVELNRRLYQLSMTIAVVLMTGFAVYRQAYIGAAASVSLYLFSVIWLRLKDRACEAELLSKVHLATAEALATAIDAKDQTTHCHVRRVQIYAVGMGELLGVSNEDISALRAGALLHDVGKLAVPAHIINKPGRLTSAEFDKMKIHTTVGAQLLSRVNFPYPVMPIVRHHHERWDGQGYPDGLKGQQIPLTARIISVVDCFDSIREDRPFRRGMSRDEAIAFLRRGSGNHFDPTIIDLFIDNLAAFEKQIAAAGLMQQTSPLGSQDAFALHEIDVTQTRERGCYMAYDQIKSAHQEVYALYELAKTFGSSLDVEETLTVLMDKVGHIVPFDTCVIYLYDEMKGYAVAAHVAGANSNLLKTRCVAPGEGVTGFALANRTGMNELHPELDLAGLEIQNDYRSMATLPLHKDQRLLGALSVYSFELNHYSEDHMRLLETVTKLASDALANAMHHAEAESNALTDPLTGLPNARYLALRFDEEAARARRTGRSFQVVMFDLDDFKIVNDTFGHKVGDKMLREMARIIQGQLREYDFLARYAGDEFVAIVQELVGNQVEELRQRIEHAVSNFSMHIRGNLRARVGISIGTASFGEDAQTFDQLLVAADQAMYRTKSAHKLEKLAQKQRSAEKDMEFDPDNLASASVN
jgi:diguanylate cyclase (GGDEF)-like protein/putative nucleotidyltransferase with HDIG domain